MCVAAPCSPASSYFFFFNDTATTEIYTLSLHDALPISARGRFLTRDPAGYGGGINPYGDVGNSPRSEEHTSELQSHLNLVFRLLLEKKKKKNTNNTQRVNKERVDALAYDAERRLELHQV